MRSWTKKILVPGVLLLMNTFNCMGEIRRQLSDNQFYKEMPQLVFSKISGWFLFTALGYSHWGNFCPDYAHLFDRKIRRLEMLTKHVKLGTASVVEMRNLGQK